MSLGYIKLQPFCSYSFMENVTLFPIYKLLNQLFALVSFCSKIFYTLKLFTLIKTLKLIAPTCFGPTGHFGAAEACLTDMLPQHQSVT